MKKKRAIIQIGDGNTMHVHDDGDRQCAFCSSNQVTGVMHAIGIRGRLLVRYCRKHKGAARDLWRFYRGQQLAIRRAEEGRCTRCGMTRAEVDAAFDRYCEGSRPHPLGDDQASQHHFVEAS